MMKSTIDFILGDSAEVLAAFPENYIDLVITSPPYDGLRKYKGFNFDFPSIAYQLSRVIKIGGVIVWVVGDQTINGCESLTSFKQAIFFVEQAKLKLHDTMIYSKHGLPLNHNRYEQQFEYMFVLVKGKLKTFNPLKTDCLYKGINKGFANKSASLSEKNSKVGGKQDKPKTTIKNSKIKGNIWHYATGNNHSSSDYIAFDHPAIFPEQLATDHIYSWSNAGDIVLDPFCGSGTTLKMAKILGRHAIGIDVSSDYLEIAKERCNQDVLPFVS